MAVTKYLTEATQVEEICLAPLCQRQWEGIVSSCGASAPHTGARKKTKDVTLSKASLQKPLPVSHPPPASHASCEGLSSGQLKHSLSLPARSQAPSFPWCQPHTAPMWSKQSIFRYICSPTSLTEPGNPPYPWGVS